MTAASVTTAGATFSGPAAAEPVAAIGALDHGAESRLQPERAARPSQQPAQPAPQPQHGEGTAAGHPATPRDQARPRQAPTQERAARAVTWNRRRRRIPASPRRGNGKGAWGYHSKQLKVGSHCYGLITFIPFRGTHALAAGNGAAVVEARCEPPRPHPRADPQGPAPASGSARQREQQPRPDPLIRASIAVAASSGATTRAPRQGRFFCDRPVAPQASPSSAWPEGFAASSLPPLWNAGAGTIAPCARGSTRAARQGGRPPAAIHHWSGAMGPSSSESRSEAHQPEPGDPAHPGESEDFGLRHAPATTADRPLADLYQQDRFTQARCFVLS